MLGDKFLGTLTGRLYKKNIITLVVPSFAKADTIKRGFKVYIRARTVYTQSLITARISQWEKRRRHHCLVVEFMKNKFDEILSSGGVSLGF